MRAEPLHIRSEQRAIELDFRHRETAKTVAHGRPRAGAADGHRRGVVKASSVLRRNVKEFSPMNVLDDSDETCWNSDSVCDTAAAARCLHVRPRAGPCGRVVAGLQPYFMPVVCALAQGSPQSLDIQFKRVVSVRQLQLTFQAGVSRRLRWTGAVDNVLWVEAVAPT
jgi:hypothetical protein